MHNERHLEGPSRKVSGGAQNKKQSQKPWLIAVTGKRGSGKTYLLAQLMDYLRREGRLFDGVLAQAEDKFISGRGAQKYILKWPLRDEEVLLCERTGSGKPPYQFNSEAWVKVGEWVDGIVQSPDKPDVIILDELGILESKGEGFAQYWDDIYKIGPSIIVASIREETKEDLEVQLGQSFDLIVHAQEEKALEKLSSLCSSARDWQRIGRFGAAAGVVEVSLGSILNATKIPFRGVPLSITQAVILFFAGSKLSRPWMVIWVSYVSAALKALSPAGNRLRPMVAIAVQGSLFGLAVKLLGWNAVGVSLGAWLVGAWAGVQGFIFQYLLLGNALFDAYGELQLRIEQVFGISIVSLPVLITLYLFSLGMLSLFVVGFFQWKERPPKLLEKALNQSLNSDGYEKKEEKRWWQKLWREYRQKAFWLPLIVVFAILMFSGSPTEELAGLLLRATGIIAAIFVVFSVLKPDRWIEKLRKLGLFGAAITMERILKPTGRLNSDKTDS